MSERVDYDRVAGGYDRRYDEHRYPGIEARLTELVAPRQRVLEVGAGTGYWLGFVAACGARVVGLDPSREMLARAMRRGLAAPLIRGRAEALPFGADAFDHVLAINALHHFDDPACFAHEARRVLTPGGCVLSVTLDPSTGADRWYLYDYFPRALELDLERYPRAAAVRDVFGEAGLVEPKTVVAERMQVDHPARDWLERGVLAKDATSQLSLLTDAQYADGIARMWHDVRAAERHGGQLRLHANLHLYATTARSPND